MQTDDDNKIDEKLDIAISTALLSAFLVEPSHDLCARILTATSQIQVQRRNRLAIATMLFSLIGISSPLVLLLLFTPGRTLGYAFWRLSISLQGMMLQYSAHSSYVPSLQALLTTAVLLFIAMLLALSATRLARTSR